MANSDSGMLSNKDLAGLYLFCRGGLPKTFSGMTRTIALAINHSFLGIAEIYQCYGNLNHLNTKGIGDRTKKVLERILARFFEEHSIGIDGLTRAKIEERCQRDVRYWETQGEYWDRESVLRRPGVGRPDYEDDGRPSNSWDNAVSVLEEIGSPCFF